MKGGPGVTGERRPEVLTVGEVTMDGRPSDTGRRGDAPQTHGGILSPLTGRSVEDGAARALLLR